MTQFDQIFVTVGTTKFELLIKRILEEETVRVLKNRGCKRLVIQAGSSKIDLPDLPFRVELYDYKNSIVEDIKKASLVIGHSGAGTVLDVLRNDKPLLIVTNDSLMDNHQEELARKLEENLYLVSCKVRDLPQALQSFNPSLLQTFPKPKPEIFADFLDSIFLV